LITITGRNANASQRLATELSGKAISWSDRHLVTPDILVNGTPVGMFPEMDDTPFQTSNLTGKTLVFDTIYNPEQTLFIKGARASQCPVVTGLQMFVRQAAYQYRLFTGKEPPVDVMVKTIKKAISPVNYKDIDDEDEQDSTFDF